MSSWLASTESQGPLRSAAPTFVVVSGCGCAQQPLHVRKSEGHATEVENQMGAPLPTGLPILWASEYLGRKIAFDTVGTPAAAVIFTRRIT